jgi:hypothetical protein
VKLFTALCLVLCFAALGSYPWTVGSPPEKRATRAVKQGYVNRSIIHLSTVCLALIGAGVGSALILRKAREEYRVTAKKNLEELVLEANRQREKNDAAG